MIATLAHDMRDRSFRLLATIEGRLNRIMTFWLLLAMSACSLRVGVGSIGRGPAEMATAFPYLMVTIAPLLSASFALRWFAGSDDRIVKPGMFERSGRWVSVPNEVARANPLYGAGGLMVSLLVGILLNMPVRLVEYLVAIPAITSGVPAWLSTLHLAMTTDVVLMTSLYTIVFVAALRRSPIFPVLLMSVWAFDLSMQVFIAKMVTAQGIPGSVAAPLHTLLDGNVKKALISVVIWLPYLLLSKRVNVTYRRRIPA